MTRCITRSRTLIGTLAAAAGLAVAAQLAFESQSPAAPRGPLQQARVQADDAQGPAPEVATAQVAARPAQVTDVRVGLPAGRRAGL